MSTPSVDFSLYVIIDPTRCAGRDPVAVARAAVRGGAGVLQLRDKAGPVSRTLALARALLAMLAEEAPAVPLVINDRADVALAVGAPGLHVGQEDLPADEARALMGEEAIIGLSLKTPEEIARAPVAALSYGAIGNVWPTTSKRQETPAIGPEGLAARVRLLRARAPGLPVIAISGVTTENAPAAIAAGADGVAVISAVCGAADPEAAARALREAVAEARRTLAKAPEAGRP
jgi:thiamine-phosphate diphosphorylase